MLDLDEMADVAAAFGVSESQVRRDHMISHVLSAIATLELALTFFGGTALARTHLSNPDLGARLSEDIDLYSPHRREVAATLDESLPRLLRREFPGSRWEPRLATVRTIEPGQLISRDGVRIRIQLLTAVATTSNSRGGPRRFEWSTCAIATPPAQRCCRYRRCPLRLP
jgi:hypothetical protein